MALKRERNPERARLARRSSALVLVVVLLNGVIRLFSGKPELWVPVAVISVAVWGVALYWLLQARKLPSRME
jgi:hypothetical protein